MKLYMDSKAFVWGTPLPILDKSGRTRYTLVSEAYSLGKRLSVLDLAGRPAIQIRQRIPSILPSYDLEIYGKPSGTVVKDISGLRPRYYLADMGWEACGAVAARDYEILSGGTAVGSTHPEPEGSLVLELGGRTHELAVLAFLLTLNCILADQDSKTL